MDVLFLSMVPPGLKIPKGPYSLTSTKQSLVLLLVFQHKTQISAVPMPIPHRAGSWRRSQVVSLQLVRKWLCRAELKCWRSHHQRKLNEKSMGNASGRIWKVSLKYSEMAWCQWCQQRIETGLTWTCTLLPSGHLCHSSYGGHVKFCTSAKQTVS